MVWRLKRLFSQDVQAQNITDMAIDRCDGHNLLSVGSDATISLYEINPNEDQHQPCVKGRLLKPQSHKHAISSVCWYHHDTGLFTTSSMDKSVKVFDTQLMQESYQFKIGSVVYAHDLSAKNLIACATSDTRLRICDLNSGAFAQTLHGHQDAISAVSWHPTEEYILVSASMDKTIKVWDIRRGGGAKDQCLMQFGSMQEQQDQQQRLVAHSAGINGLQFSSDGKYLLSTAMDSSLCKWNYKADQGDTSPSQLNDQRLNNKYFTLRRMSIINSQQLLFPNDDGSILVINLNEMQVQQVLDGCHFGRVNGALTHPTNSKVMYSAGNDGRIAEWAAVNSQESNQLLPEWQILDPGDSWSD
ncbi:hypothetical protein MIR68_008335 [Amoeboaphelidium protococcarum]|nr:hypothetical protein MIR68_008335 [Amoeboaphelidium protococcarum]